MSKKFSKGWWDELDEWFWEDVFKIRYGSKYESYRFATEDEDFYDGVDAIVSIVFASANIDRRIQLKAQGDEFVTSEDGSLSINNKETYVRLKYRASKGYDAGFGTYFRGDDNVQGRGGNKPIHEFVFAFPFIGKSLFITYSGMYDFWHDFITTTDDNYVKKGSGKNEYYLLNIDVFMENLPENTWKLYNTPIMDRNEVMKNYG